MRKYLKYIVYTLSPIVFLVSIIWFYYERGFEPFLAIIATIISLVTLYIDDTSDRELINQLKVDFNTKSLLLISKLIKKIDYRVLKKVRSLKIENFKPLELDDYYKSFIKKLGKRKNLQIIHLLNYINSKQFKPVLSDEVDFTVTIEKGFKGLELRNHNSKIVQIDNPRLMWECSCNGNTRRNKKNCPIHQQFELKEAKAFSSDFRNGLILIKYDNVKVFWVNEKDLWPPSVDSFNLIEDLKSENYHKKKITSAIDIGSGTGILGIWLAKNNRNIKELDFTDWLLLPLFFTKANTIFNNLKTNSNYYLGLNFSWFSKKRTGMIYDLIICNPPYLPELGFKKMGKQSTVAGTQLLKSVIKYGLDRGKEVVISFSNIVLPEAIKAAKEGGVMLKKIGEPHLVPFRVPIALKQKGYIEKLISEREIEQKDDSNFKYWHTINTYKVKRLPKKATSNNGFSSKSKVSSINEN